MTDLVPADQIEQIVGIKRHDTKHYGRAVSAEEQVYILHSRECKDSGVDLRQCPYSLALDNGIQIESWVDLEDIAVALVIVDDRLVPAVGATDA
ncbi:hypothetical protein H7J86_24365 [Mycobacterium hackensackense]|uniref:hypothetical protein n=1 Tax=Mycobacterium hackensackense TaxID=228909 RepID=UPI002265A3DF|nr:hypothetical protein [Mycobacterium hackensackense]MCV7255302.1 hypothetical protein [Mycobacterium hackensackense]